MVYPDIELHLTGYLRDALTGRPESYAQDVHVSNAVPNPRRDHMVTVRRDGGVQASLLDQPRVTVGVWATTEQDATDLARLVAALLWAAPNGAPLVSAVMVGGPVAIADAQPRRSMVYEFTTRGSELAP